MTQGFSQLFDALADDWRQILQLELDQPYLQQLQVFLAKQRAEGKCVYPPEHQLFSALQATSMAAVKVVILGQDPYHGVGQANGLAFSVPEGVAIPPSLKNIYQELQSDLGVTLPSHGNLYPWAKQGVLLLNAVLSVEQQQAASHKGQGWEQLTDKIIESINQQCEHVVFLLWGAYAQKKGRFINTDKHLVLTSVHPSPLSAYRGFFGCRHFSQCNDYLQQWGESPIGWQL